MTTFMGRDKCKALSETLKRQLVGITDTNTREMLGKAFVNINISVQWDKLNY